MDAIKAWLAEFFTKIASELKSRKFWALVGAVLVAVQGYAVGEITHWQMITAIIAALAAYSTGIALVKASMIVSGSEYRKK